MHNRDEKEWNEIGHPSDYGPFAYAGGKETFRIPTCLLHFVMISVPSTVPSGLCENFCPKKN